jgi:hypothetical protein
VHDIRCGRQHVLHNYWGAATIAAVAAVEPARSEATNASVEWTKLRVTAQTQPMCERRKLQMKTTLLVGAIIGLFATSSWAASNLNLSKSNVNRVFPKGQFVTASSDISGAVSQLVYTTPPTGDFILTQVCTGVVTGGTLVQVGGVRVAQIGSGLCQTFTPGMAVSNDQNVTCTTFAEDANTFCTITGVLEPPAPKPRP